MTDIFSKEKRSEIMSRITAKNTKPELLVRSFLHRCGFRYSLHKKTLPGKPDIYLKKYKTVVFVHGCFWHMHENCRDFSLPKTNTEWWKKKLQKNKARDIRVYKKLEQLGFNVIIVWECELKTIEKRENRFKKLVKQIRIS